MGTIDILVVDDMTSVTTLVRDAFQIEGHSDVEVHCASSGEEGVELYKRYSPAVVLCDFKMINGDGPYLIREIRNHDPHARIIIMSCYPDVQETALMLGANGFITKPFKLEQMIKSVLAYANGEYDCI